MAIKNTSFKSSILMTSTFVALIWWLKICEQLFNWDLRSLGVYPMEISGLIGIITAPLIHGSWEHLLGNTLPILLLGSMLLYGYPKSRSWTITIIWLVSGIGVWVFGRGSLHFGASGIAHGLFFFLFISGLFRRDKRSSVLLMVAFFMYGSMLMTIFPTAADVSFEAHLFGAIGGTISAILFRNLDAKPTRRVYSWELPPESEDNIEQIDPIIGDQWKTDKQLDAEKRQERTLH